jgi:hypothetical protein
MSTFSVIYYLTIKNVPFLLEIFPSFIFFLVPSVGLGIPLSILLGWLHLKGTGIFSREIDVAVEASPYNWKLTPGVWQDVLAPNYLLILNLLERLSIKSKLLTTADQTQIANMKESLKFLIAGGEIASAKRKSL